MKIVFDGVEIDQAELNAEQIQYIENVKSVDSLIKYYHEEIRALKIARKHEKAKLLTLLNQ